MKNPKWTLEKMPWSKGLMSEPEEFYILTKK